jgi:chromate transport protein ChrA
MSDDDAPLHRPASAGELFVAFNRLALQGFGGVLAVAQRELVEHQRWGRRARRADAGAAGDCHRGGRAL